MPVRIIRRDYKWLVQQVEQCNQLQKDTAAVVALQGVAIKSIEGVQANQQILLSKLSERVGVHTSMFETLEKDMKVLMEIASSLKDSAKADTTAQTMYGAGYVDGYVKPYDSLAVLMQKINRIAAFCDETHAALCMVHGKLTQPQATFYFSIPQKLPK